MFYDQTGFILNFLFFSSSFFSLFTLRRRVNIAMFISITLDRRSNLLEVPPVLPVLLLSILIRFEMGFFLIILFILLLPSLMLLLAIDFPPRIVILLALLALRTPDLIAALAAVLVPARTAILVPAVLASRTIRGIREAAPPSCTVCRRCCKVK